MDITQEFWIFFIFSPSNDDIKALIAQAHRSVTKSGEGGGSGPAPIITDLIDNIMSIPSCLQDAKSKVTLVREWIKQVKKKTISFLLHFIFVRYYA